MFKKAIKLVKKHTHAQNVIGNSQTYKFKKKKYIFKMVKLF